jgi:hypothetical protein
MTNLETVNADRQTKAEARYAELLRLFDAGWPVDKIATNVDRPVNATRSALRAARIRRGDYVPGARGRNHELTREDRRRGGSRWTEAKAATVGRHFEEHNERQRAAARARFEKVKLLRDNGLTWPEVSEFLGQPVNSVKALFYKLSKDTPQSGDLTP